MVIELVCDLQYPNDYRLSYQASKPEFDRRIRDIRKPWRLTVYFTIAKHPYAQRISFFRHLVFQVEEGEEDLVLYYESDTGESVFMAVE